MRKKKVRPKPSDGIQPGMSQRDLVSVLDGLMSRHQIQQALAVASIPEDQFDAMIESDDPPTVTRLSEIGRGKPRRKRNLAGRPAKLTTCLHCGKAIK